MRQPKKVPVPAAPSLMKTVRAKQSEVFADMGVLSKKYGAEVFRIAGQRYFTRQREEAALREQIAEREAELARLRQRTSR